MFYQQGDYAAIRDGNKIATYTVVKHNDSGIWVEKKNGWQYERVKFPTESIIPIVNRVMNIENGNYESVTIGNGVIGIKKLCSAGVTTTERFEIHCPDIDEIELPQSVGIDMHLPVLNSYTGVTEYVGADISAKFMYVDVVRLAKVVKSNIWIYGFGRINVLIMLQSGCRNLRIKGIDTIVNPRKSLFRTKLELIQEGRKEIATMQMLEFDGGF